MPKKGDNTEKWVPRDIYITCPST